MKSLFNTAERNEIIERIASINDNSEKQWGKMSAAQMLSHCQQPIRIGIGDLKLSTNLLFMILGPFIKKKLMKEEPFDKHLPTHKDFIIKEEPSSLTDERQKLIDLVNALNDKKDNLAVKHPIFGKMSPQQWDSLNWKHLDHHLRQFGA
jgi:hypothetical protein